MNLDYETLDTIADSYIPLLCVWVLVSVYLAVHRGDRYGVKRQLKCLLSGLVIVYGLMFLDEALAIWPAFDLDYSTHTALSLMFILYLSKFQPGGRVLQFVSFVAYLLLMRYQEYHSYLDMVTTGLIVGGAYLWSMKKMMKSF
ncbi:hypothetical protein M3P05_05335 [Sansalvadorimonas sp. 2012CJ34-2]|uniref:PAP2 superfamily protein n=1 Tax=Parendozoicomonas callyspongiae TaxID=2942213 RepID=A0ABT0PFQ7_9GAMM|nr:hypothetical protein [Sansalvadorimonas sp. 2012CJ34-2]MCL6269368.1 hypothetical protein [Sansalvadorimonas sp. 2012CJ34-2]